MCLCALRAGVFAVRPGGQGQIYHGRALSSLSVSGSSAKKCIAVVRKGVKMISPNDAIRDLLCSGFWSVYCRDGQEDRGSPGIQLCPEVDGRRATEVNQIGEVLGTAGLLIITTYI